MKEYLKGLKIGLGVFSILLVLGAVTFFVIKSRTATDPGLGDNGSSLYTSVNETLTAAKRNALVKKATTSREDVVTSDTALFDQNCDRRRKGQGNDGNIAWIYPYSIYFGGQRIRGSAGVAFREIQYNTKGTISSNDGVARTLQKLQKKCQ